MHNIVDLIVIGAGPAGLMTAKRAAELGLKVTIIELKKDITTVKRACSSQFVTDEGYQNETIKIDNNKIIFTKNKFHINYTGPLLNIINNYHHSLSGHKLHLSHPDHRPFAITFDKGHLFADLWRDCEKLGVTLLLETVAYRGKDLGDHVRVDIRNHKNISYILGKN